MLDQPIPYPRVASELIRALRGRHAPPTLSRRLGYATNVIYRWEIGSRFPTATEALRLAALLGHEVYEAQVAFDHHLATHKALSRPDRDAVAALLRALTAHLRITTLARQTGLSRFALSRMLSGQVEPRLPDFLQIVEVATGRLIDWIAAFVDPSALPSLADRARSYDAMRSIAYDAPFSEAVLAALETSAYAPGGKHTTGELGRLLGITVEQEESILQVLSAAGAIRWNGRWEVDPGRRIDTRNHPEALERLKLFWARHAIARQAVDGHNLMAYSVASVSQETLEEIERLLRDCYRAVRNLCASSEGCHRVALMQIQICPLDGKPVVAEEPDTASRTAD